MRLAMTRASRRRSPLMMALSARVDVADDRELGADETATALRTNWLTRQVLEVEADSPGVEPADLEEVLDQSAESGHVADEEVEGGLGSFGHLVTARLHHVDRRRQRHQRRAQFMGDVRGEPRVALDPLLERRRHVVERAGEDPEVRVVSRNKPRLESAAGDRLGRFGRVGDRANGTAGSQHTDEHAKSGRDRRGEEERQRDVRQRLVVLLEVEELEVLGVDAYEAECPRSRTSLRRSR